MPFPYLRYAGVFIFIMFTGIIYKATNKTNGKSFIGYAQATLEDAIKAHIARAGKNKKSSDYFSKALACYKPGNFSWEVVDYIEEEDATRLEISLEIARQYHIMKNRSYRECGGYNSVMPTMPKREPSEIVIRNHPVPYEKSGIRRE